MLAETQLLVAQDNVEEPPRLIWFGFALKFVIEQGGGLLT